RFTSVIHASTLPQGAIPASLIFHPAAFRGGLFTQAFWTIPHPHGRFPRVTGTIDSSSLNGPRYGHSPGLPFRMKKDAS
ncbi:hypothetical protein, partial [Akkermansia sp.]|uniref:hypothetical protein n=1 Tax=Akkermansia sp. TaxID=1872421 RepID=UPI0025C23664